MEEILCQYNPWWDDDFSLKEQVESRPERVREIASARESRRLVFLAGIRRVGKSTLMKLLAYHLVERGIAANEILYVSLDDYLLRHAAVFEILTRFRKIHKHSVERHLTLLLDEITYQPDFQQQLKTLVDRENVAIVAASSSSSLLKDKKGMLTGRSTTIEIQPLSLEEYLQFSGISISRKDSHLLDAYFQEYARVGGIPEQVLRPSRDYLMNLIDDIIQKDIAAFHGVKDHHVLRDYFTLLMERSGKQVSVNKIANILGLSPDTSRRYLTYFEETYLIHLVSRWGKTNKRVLSPKKAYACDLGMKHLFVGDRDWGSYFENYVYLLIRRHQDSRYLIVESTEIDFLTHDAVLIEAKYNGEITGKQAELFREFPAKARHVIRSVEELKVIGEIWA